MLTRRASSFSSLPVGTSGAIFGSAWGYRPIPANTSNLTSLTFTASLHSLGAVTTAADWQTAGPTEVELALRVADTVVPSHAPSHSSLQVDPMGAVNVSWTVDLSQYATSPAAVVELTVTATSVSRSGTSDVPSALALPLRVVMHLGEWGCVPADTVPKEDLCL
jgi:hypothetical protein